MELGTCWALVMALTGYYLFVRGWRAGAQPEADRAGARLRSRHGLIGVFVGVGLLAHDRDRPAVDGALGRPGADARDRRTGRRSGAGPGRCQQPVLDARRVAAAQPRPSVPWALEQLGGARRPRSRATTSQRRERRHRDRGRGSRGAAAPDDGGAAGRTTAGTFSAIGYAFDAAERRADRARRPVRRQGARRRTGSTTTRCWPRWSPRGSACTRAAASGSGRTWSARRLFCLAVICDVRDRAADVVAPPAQREWDGRSARAGCRSPGHPCSRSVWSLSGCSCRCSGSACSSYCCWTGSCCGGSRRSRTSSTSHVRPKRSLRCR